MVLLRVLHRRRSRSGWSGFDQTTFCETTFCDNLMKFIVINNNILAMPFKVLGVPPTCLLPAANASYGYVVFPLEAAESSSCKQGGRK